MPRITLDVIGLDHSDIVDALNNAGIVECQCCNGFTSENDTQNVQVSDYRRDYESWCQDCASSTSVCDDCGETVAEDYITHYDCGTALCSCCYQNGDYSTCCDCDALLNLNCGNFVSDQDTGELYCESCGESHVTPDGVAQYHSDPIRKQWGKVPSGAVSVEIECYCMERDTLANELRESHGCAVERDGSLCCSNGLEVITAPKCVDTAIDTLRGILGTLREHKATAWQQGDGYGIHVNLDARNWDADTYKRFCNLFSTTNKHWLEKLAGRSENSWARYKATDDDKVPPDSSKYSAATLKSGGRVEVRIFRSTTNVESAVGYLTFCLDCLRYAQSENYTGAKGLLDYLKTSASYAETSKLLEARKVIETV